MNTSRLTIKGQVTVPKKLRDAFGWAPHTELKFEQMVDGIKLTGLKKSNSRGEKLVKRLRGKGNRKWSSDDILGMTRGEDE